MKTEEHTFLTEVFSGSPWEAELVKGLLESAGIQSMLKDGMMGTIAPYIVNTVTIMVMENDYEAAMKIVRSRENAEDKDSDIVL